VRCGRRTATPYLRKNINVLNPMGIKDPTKVQVVDIGCGNGRNSDFMKENGYENVLSLDMVNDYGYKIVLGEDKIPIPNKSADIILANYILMFLDDGERAQLIGEIQRIAKSGCSIMVELYPAKDSVIQTQEEMLTLQDEIFRALGWDKVRYSQGRFIAQK
jgi:SAM-dependent methyltransferase